MGTRSSWWLIGASALLVAGCTGPPRPGPAPGPGPVGPRWQQVTLPVMGAGRPVIRDVAACPGHWYAVGGYQAGDGATTPAIWSSGDGRDWQPVPTRPVSAYGPAHLLSAAACRGDTVVAVGSAAGGAHGNPRTGTWIATGGGPLTEVPAGFELFGGPTAIGVGRLAAGRAGWVLSGARQDANGMAGAAVWTAPDGRSFQLVDGDPALESDGRGYTTAQAVTATPDGYALVGSVFPPHRPAADRDPAAWTSADGLTWHRDSVPAAGQDADLEQVVAYHDGLLAVGVRGDGFGAWRRTGHDWRAVARFGRFDGSGLPLVTGAAVGADGTAYVAACDGSRYRLWSSGDGATWSELPLPGPVAAGAQHQIRLASAGGRLLLAAEDGSVTCLWLAASLA